MDSRVRATFDARGDKATLELLVDANYVSSRKCIVRAPKNEKKSSENDICLPLDGELSFFQFSQD